MSIVEIKEQLYNAIDAIEDEDFLEALLTITNCRQSNNDAQQASEEELKILREREARYQRGESKATPWKEAQGEIKKKYGF